MKCTKPSIVSVLWLFLALLPLCQLRAQQPLSPLNYGLREALTGQERYQVLYRCHADALAQGVGVSYEGIDTLWLDVPLQAKSIPLTDSTHFSDVVIFVSNTSQSHTLFTYSCPFQSISVPAWCIDSADFRSVDSLATGTYLLSIRDANPWTFREGYGYNHYRQDVMIVHQGVGLSRPVMPYANQQSLAQCAFRSISLTDRPFYFGHLTLHRLPGSTFITRLLGVSGCNGVVVSDVSITTPSGSGLYGDAAIAVSNSTHVLFRDLDVQGTYSLRNQYGYGYTLNNVWDFKALRVSGFAPWGIFGGNNIHRALIEDCHLNRFDIHCYGRDITSLRTHYAERFNQFSATYGTILFDSCIFTDFKPYRNAYSYNAMVPLNLVFRHCQIHLKHQKNCIVRLDGIMGKVNPRPELTRKYLPTLQLVDCDVYGTPLMHRWYLYYLGDVENTDPVFLPQPPQLIDVRLHWLREPALFSQKSFTTALP